MTFAGIITEVRAGTTKTGKPYGSIILEDFTDSHKMLFFSNDWIDFNKYFVVGYALLIKGKVQPKPFGDNELEIRVKTINMLANVREELVKSISIIVPLQIISDDLIMELKEHTNHKGKVELHFKVVDKSENLTVDLFSRTQRISLSEDLINYLGNCEEIDFRLN
jgi:DNA polymerase-3 subunit alpha